MDEFNDIKMKTELEKDEEARRLAVEITEEPKNIMLSASAGSGKTYTLVKRIVNHILRLPEDKHVDGFAVVTFTKAAASELSEKIENALNDIIIDKDNEYTEAEKKRAHGESLLIQRAMIGTIDSFCLDVVEKNFAKAGISPKISIEQNEESFLAEIMDEVLEKRYGKDRKSEEFLPLSKLVDILGDINGDDGLKKQLLLPVIKLMYTLPNPKEWAKKISSYYEITSDVRENIWYKKMKDIFILYIKACIDHAERLERKLSDGEYEINQKALNAYIDCIINDEENLKNFLQIIESDNGKTPILFSADINLKFKTLPTPKLTDEEKAEKEVVKAEREIYRSVIKETLQETFFKNEKNAGSEEKENHFTEGIAKISKYIRTVLDICIEIYDESLAVSKQRNKYTFSQIAHLALAILIEGDISNDGVDDLVPTEVALSYRKRFIEIYIDEYQDTTPLQEYIMYIVSGNQEGRNNIFNVGDVKQSIYGFRNATPQLFLDKYKTFKNNPEKGLLLNLSRNFRCRKGIIEGTNDIFEKIMTMEVSDVDYNDGQRLTFGAEKDYNANPFPGGEENGKCELIICEEKPKDDNDENASDAGEDNTPNEYGAVAEKIAELFENNFLVVNKETKKQETLKFSDICIIARQKEALTYARNFLKKCGFPCDAVPDNFFDRSEIIDVMSFLRVVDNPHNDIEIAALLKSNFFNFTNGDLLKIASKKKKDSIRGDFYDAVKKLSEKDWELASKLKEFLVEINTVRKLSLEMNVSQLVWYVIQDKNYYNNCDEIEKGNLRLLQKEASLFDNGINGGLYSFISSVDKKMEITKRNPKIAVESYAPPTEASDKIKFMTVHGSKGLEFPVVFIVGTNKGIRPSKGASVSVNNGIGFPVDLGRRIVHSAPYNVIRKTKAIEELKEEQRLLYVGLTRAREKLFVTGTVSKTEIKTTNHNPIISNMSVRNWKNFYDMISNTIGESKAWKVSYVINDDVLTAEQYKEKFSDILYNYNAVTETTEEDSNDMGTFASFKNEAEELFREAVSYADNGTLPLKISVSSLKHYSIDEEGNTNDISVHQNDLRNLHDVNEEKNQNSGTAFGTLMHKVMRFLVDDRDKFCEINAFNVDNYVNDFIVKKISEKIFTEEDDKNIDRDMIKKFLLSDIAKEISLSTDLRCEIPFTFMTDINKYIACENLEKEFKGPNRLAIQGVVDLYYIFNGRVVILDYKTDKIFTEESLKSYRIQLQCYSDALESISGEKVSKKVLFHLREGKSIEV